MNWVKMDLLVNPGIQGLKDDDEAEPTRYPIAMDIDDNDDHGAGVYNDDDHRQHEEQTGKRGCYPF